MSREAPYPWLPVSPHTLAGVTSPGTGPSKGLGPHRPEAPPAPLWGAGTDATKAPQDLYAHCAAFISRVSAGVEEAEMRGMRERDCIATTI